MVSVPTTHRRSLGSGPQATLETLRLMRDIILKSQSNMYVRRWAERIVSSAPEDSLARVHAMYDFIKGHTKYIWDPRGFELLKVPTVTLNLWDAGETSLLDCDDYTILTLSLLKAVGYQVLIRAAGYRNQPLSHVYGFVMVDDNWIALDLTKNYGVGWEPPGATSHVDMRVDEDGDDLAYVGSQRAFAGAPLGAILSDRDTLQKDKVYTFTYNTDKFIQTTFEETYQRWIKFYLSNWGNVINVKRAVGSSALSITVVPYFDATVSAWTSQAFPYAFASSQIDNPEAYFVQVEGGSSTSDPGGLPGVVKEGAEGITDVVKGAIGPIFPYLLIGSIALVAVNKFVPNFSDLGRRS